MEYNVLLIFCMRHNGSIYEEISKTQTGSNPILFIQLAATGDNDLLA